MTKKSRDCICKWILFLDQDVLNMIWKWYIDRLRVRLFMYELRNSGILDAHELVQKDGYLSELPGLEIATVYRGKFGQRHLFYQYQAPIFPQKDEWGYVNKYIHKAGHSYDMEDERHWEYDGFTFDEVELHLQREWQPREVLTQYSESAEILMQRMVNSKDKYDIQVEKIDIPEIAPQLQTIKTHFKQSFYKEDFFIEVNIEISRAKKAHDHPADRTAMNIVMRNSQDFNDIVHWKIFFHDYHIQLIKRNECCLICEDDLKLEKNGEFRNAFQNIAGLLYEIYVVCCDDIYAEKLVF